MSCLTIFEYMHLCWKALDPDFFCNFSLFGILSSIGLLGDFNNAGKNIELQGVKDSNDC